MVYPARANTSESAFCDGNYRRARARTQTVLGVRLTCPKNGQSAKPDEFPLGSKNVGSEFVAWRYELYDQREKRRCEVGKD